MARSTSSSNLSRSQKQKLTTNKTTRPRRQSSTTFPNRRETRKVCDESKTSHIQEPDAGGGPHYALRAATVQRRRPVSLVSHAPQHYGAGDGEGYDTHRNPMLCGHRQGLDAVNATKTSRDLPAPSSRLSSTFTATRCKRKGSTEASDLNPKRLRLNSAPNRGKHVQEGQLPMTPRPSTAAIKANRSATLIIPTGQGNRLATFPVPSQNSDQPLLNTLVERPQKLSLDQIAGLFHVVQNLTRSFAQVWFGIQETDNADGFAEGVRKFSIRDLKLKHPLLYLTTMHILDATTTNATEECWVKFFAQPQHRQFLAYAILGEWFTQRIFKDAGFGLPEHFRNRMRKDVEESHDHENDFVRARLRSKVICDYVAHVEASAIQASQDRAAKALANELVEVLRPLLSCSDGEAQDHSKLRLSLIGLIKTCAGLSMSIICTGCNGTVVRIADRLENGRKYSPTALMCCINQEMLTNIQDEIHAGSYDRLVVKMNCWALVEALMPQGLDQVELTAIEEGAGQGHDRQHVKQLEDDEELAKSDILKAPDKFSLGSAESRPEFQLLPRNQHPATVKKQLNRESDARTGEIHRRINLKEVRKTTCSGGHGGANSSNSEYGDELLTMPPINAVKLDDPEITKDTQTGSRRGHGCTASMLVSNDHESLHRNWMTYSRILTPHQVYCEWAKPGFDSAEVLRAHDRHTVETLIRQVNGVAAAVRNAPANFEYFRWLNSENEDLLLGLWNIYAKHHLKIEWGAFLLAAVCGLHYGGVVNITKGLGPAPLDLVVTIGKGVLTGAVFIKEEFERFLAQFGGRIRHAPPNVVGSVGNSFLIANFPAVEDSIPRDHNNGQLSISSLFEILGSWPSITDQVRRELTQVATAVSAAAASTFTTTMLAGTAMSSIQASPMSPQRDIKKPSRTARVERETGKVKCEISVPGTTPRTEETTVNLELPVDEPLVFECRRY